MRTAIAPLIVLAAAGCAGSPDIRDMAPYKAVVVFEWLGEEPMQPGGGVGAEPVATGRDSAGGGNGGAPPMENAGEQLPLLDRRWVEDEIILGIEDQGIFSDFVVADWETMSQIARQEEADLIVLIRIGHLARWDEAKIRIDPGLAILDALLWFGTAIGGLWVADQEFPTDSDIEISWKRPAEVIAAGRVPGANRLDSVRQEFRERERLSSGEYRLSLWERAKPWSHPGAYLMNILMPAFAVPFRDASEVSRSLTAAALGDIKRELAQKLRGSSLRSGRAPFLFRLEEPANGTTVAERSARLRYRYRIEPGFEAHKTTGLHAIRIELKREGDAGYRMVREHRGEGILAINEEISRDAVREETIEGLGPGLNLIRFSAQTELGGQWITNTIALRSP